MKKVTMTSTLPKTTGALILGLCSSHVVLADQTTTMPDHNVQTKQNISQPDELPSNAIYDNHIDINAENEKIQSVRQADIDETVNQSQEAIKTDTQTPDNLLRFPVTTQLTLGTVKPAQHNETNLHVAFFVIGDDPTSLAWARQHKAQIKQSHAIGYVTQVASKARFDAIVEETGLLLMPMTADPLAKMLNIQHYPFFYSNGKVFQ